jgi:hypothetical protein
MKVLPIFKKPVTDKSGKKSIRGFHGFTERHYPVPLA